MGDAVAFATGLVIGLNLVFVHARCRAASDFDDRNGLR